MNRKYQNESRHIKNKMYVEDAEFSVYDSEGEMVKTSYPIPTAKRPAGKISGILLSVFGWMIVAISVAIALGVSVTAVFFQSILSALIFPVITIVIGIVMIVAGGKRRRRVRLFYDYLKKIGRAGFAEIKKLSSDMEQSERYIKKQFTKMIELDMFPEACFNEDKSYIFLSEKIYKEYLKMEEGKRLLEEKRQQQEKALEERQKKEQSDPIYHEIYSVIDQGEAAIQEIHELNDKILDASVSEKMTNIELVLQKIFKYLEENPSSLSESRKFLNYYLPTTLKLLNSYEHLDREPIQGPTIIKTKKEIENSMETIDNAFQKFLDSFYQDTALDILSEIDVLETMLAQEGLTEKDTFGKEKDER